MTRTPYEKSDEADLRSLEAELLRRWREGESLITLDLRSACHAAMRLGRNSDAAAISALIEDREAKGGTS